MFRHAKAKTENEREREREIQTVIGENGNMGSIIICALRQVQLERRYQEGWDEWTRVTNGREKQIKQEFCERASRKESVWKT